MTTISNSKNKKRKYYRKCGICGKRDEQSNMVRTDESPNGWLCSRCYEEITNEYDWDDGYSSNGL